MIEHFKKWMGKSYAACLVQTEAEWLREMLHRYASLEEVSFRCPDCRKVQNVQEFIQQGNEAYQVYEVCSHCQKHIRKMRFAGRYVIDENGQQHPLFDFG
jgi:hypothetical protein